jgi:hypothetical protein
VRCTQILVVGGRVYLGTGQMHKDMNDFIFGMLHDVQVCPPRPTNSPHRAASPNSSASLQRCKSCESDD